jgi:hypothetical protein
MSQLYYDIKNDKGYRIVGTFANLVHVKEVKTTTWKAKMNAPIKTFSTSEWTEFSKDMTTVNK